MVEGLGDLIRVILLVLGGACFCGLHLSHFISALLFASFPSLRVVEAVMPPVALLGCGVLVQLMSRY
jgi:hypothetical protein